MIADDTAGIRKAMEQLDWQRKVAEAEVRLKAQQGDKNRPPAPAPKPLLDEPGAPFRGFFVEGLEPPVRGLQFTDGTRSLPVRDSNFDFDEYEQAWDEWDGVTLDSGVTEKTAPLFFWGKLE